MAPRNPVRVEAVKRLREVAARLGVARASDNASSGAIVDAYKDALQQNKLKPFAGEDASWQPSDLADLFMHETVAAWVRKYFQSNPLCKTADLKKNWRSFDKGIKDCEKHINKSHDVHGLCRAMHMRLRQLRDSGGDRLRY